MNGVPEKGSSSEKKEEATVAGVKTTGRWPFRVVGDGLGGDFHCFGVSLCLVLGRRGWSRQ